MGFIRSLLIGIDFVIYGILEQIFLLIINLANFDLFTGDVLKNFSQRIYLILGLVMVFKLILSFIQMLIDPDKISDKENGVASILKRVVISMILITLVPSIFSFAKSLQNVVVPAIPKIVLGVKIDAQSTENYDLLDPVSKLEAEQNNLYKRTGKLMAYYTFLPFFYYNEGCNGLGTLKGTTSEHNLMDVQIDSVGSAVSHVNDKSGCSATDDGYDYNYRYIVATLVGAFLVYVLVTIALKIAIRTIKFGLCELVAPIPIASYIDPKSSKKTFDNWVSTSVKVYLDLFTRLIVVYFIVYIFKLLFDNEKFLETLGKYGEFQGLLVALFIITGLLYFAKEMPKFISNMLGVPDGFSDMADMFKGQGWKAIGGTLGSVSNTVSAGLSAYNYSRGFRHENRVTALRRALGATFASGGRSIASVANGQGYQGTVNARNATLTNVRRRSDNAYNKREGKREYRRQVSEYNTAMEQYDEKMEQYNRDMAKYNKDMKSYNNAQAKIPRYQNHMKQAITDRTMAMQNYLKAKKAGDAAAAANYYKEYEKAKRTIGFLENSIKKSQNMSQPVAPTVSPTAPSKPVRPSSYGIGRLQAEARQFAGTPMATSKTIRETASLLTGAKSKIFNSAKQKVIEKPTLIQDQITFKDDNGKTYNSGKFEEIFNAYMDMKEGRLAVDAAGKIKSGRFAGLDRSQMESIYGNAWKSATAIYIDKAMNDKDTSVTNVTLVQDIRQFETKFADAIIDRADRTMITADMDAARQKSVTHSADNPGGLGNFFMHADDLGAQLESVALDREKTEPPASGS